MRFKFILAIALILCAFCVLPVNAYYFDNVPVLIANANTDTYNHVVTNTDTVYIIAAGGSTTPQNPTPVLSVTSQTTINGQTLTSSNVRMESISISSNSITMSQCLNYGVTPVIINNPNHLSTITYTAHIFKSINDGYVDITGTIQFNYENFTDPLETAYIEVNQDHYTDNTVTYNVQCKSDYPNIVYYSSIGNERDFTLGLINYNEEETQTEITTGLEGIDIYAWCMNTNTGNIKQIENYLQGRSEIQIIDPTVQPTDMPVYPERIQAFIQTYDYQNGNMLSGVNMSVYEVIENGDNLQIGNKIYSSINAESQTILTVKNNTEYFIENELIGYYAVKNENVASLDNRYGYLWNPTLINPLRLYYSRLDPTAQYNANFIVQDVNNNGIAGVTVTMDNSITKISNSIGGLTFNNVSAGTHTFTFIKNGYQSAQRTIDIQLQYAAFTQTLFKDDQIIQPTVSPTGYPTTYPTVSPTAQPTLSPIDKPSNIMESVSFGFAKIFGVKTVENANYIFALMLILFPAVVAGGITHQALGFIAGGMIGFVFALAVGLIPIWVFFAMCLLAVIYFVLKGGNEGF